MPPPSPVPATRTHAYLALAFPALLIAGCVAPGERTRYEVRCPGMVVETVVGEWVGVAAARIVVRDGSESVASYPRECSIRALGRVGVAP